MSTPDPKQEAAKTPWHENWAEAFEGGFYDNLDGTQEKKALLVETDAHGNSRVVGVATGADAQQLIASAEASGMEVLQDAAVVEEFADSGPEPSSAAEVPPEIYELMSTVIEFAKELTEEWVVRDGHQPIPRPKVNTELEFSHEDL